MTDKIEVEGSPERAADRGREVDLGFSMDRRPSLGDAGVVRGLVSKFADDVVVVRRQYLLDELSGQECIDKVTLLAKEAGDIIMGRNDAYVAMPWNSPERLGRRIGLVLPPEDGIEDPGELLFFSTGSSLISLAAAHEANNIPDTEAEHVTKTMLEDVINLILGIR